jgi:hypothetical protein
LAENPSEDDLAVDQHPIAIEDDESRQKRSLSWSAFGAYMAPDYELSPLHGSQQNDSPAFSMGRYGAIVTADIPASTEETYGHYPL